MTFRFKAKMRQEDIQEQLGEGLCAFCAWTERCAELVDEAAPERRVCGFRWCVEAAYAFAEQNGIEIEEETWHTREN